MAVTAQAVSLMSFSDCSIDEWLLSTLQMRGPQTLTDLSNSIPDAQRTPLFLAVDRLSRSGDIVVGCPTCGDYMISARHQVIAKGASNHSAHDVELNGCIKEDTRD
ncbi:hypothetical protein W02_01230 [Nitrospira sp. KM1]|nr:hypothetical protein W02_01230 [Nitrospira sp. KM1]